MRRSLTCLLVLSALVASLVVASDGAPQAHSAATMSAVTHDLDDAVSPALVRIERTSHHRATALLVLQAVLVATLALLALRHRTGFVASAATPARVPWWPATASRAPPMVATA